MNKDKLRAVFKNYIEKFEYLNDDDHTEYYKWQVCHKFRPLMDQALAADTDHFADALFKVRECSENIIDSNTQPFYGLVCFARNEPETVRKMFLDLYENTEGDLEQQMKQISVFFERSRELLNTYNPGSHLYKQNSHAVSSYLFLYDPDHYYMYKATQSQIMADCIGFYDSWGSGDNIRLDVYYRMCEKILAEIRNCPELLAANQSRYDGCLNMRPGELHEDKEYHILLFDIIYCAHVYNLYEGIRFARPKAKEKQLILEKREKAQQLFKEYQTAVANNNLLNEAREYIFGLARSTDVVQHKKFGPCRIVDVEKKYIRLYIPQTDEEKKLSLSTLVVNGIISFDAEGYKEKFAEYRDVLKREDTIPKRLDAAEKALIPYEEYLD